MAEIKQQLQSEMGLLPVHLLRDRRMSFVELYSSDNLGNTDYGTAGYLGNGYFITVKHAVVALADDDNRQNGRKIIGIHDRAPRPGGSGAGGRHRRCGRRSPPWRLGDHQDGARDGPSGTARRHVLRLRVRGSDLQAGQRLLQGDHVSTGYVGQHTSNGLITCLTDGHPGVSGGGVLNQHGDLVGIPIGRMKDDFRFSFLLPLRAEMFRKLPSYEPPTMPSVVAAEPQ